MFLSKYYQVLKHYLHYEADFFIARMLGSGLAAVFVLYTVPHVLFTALFLTLILSFSLWPFLYCGLVTLRVFPYHGLKVSSMGGLKFYALHQYFYRELHHHSGVPYGTFSHQEVESLYYAQMYLTGVCMRYKRYYVTSYVLSEYNYMCMGLLPVLLVYLQQAQTESTAALVAQLDHAYHVMDPQWHTVSAVYPTLGEQAKAWLLLSRAPVIKDVYDTNLLLN